jgi:hypothetical protein
LTRLPLIPDGESQAFLDGKMIKKVTILPKKLVNIVAV